MEQIIREIFAKKQIDLPKDQLEKLSIYGNLVLATNKTMNLTAITEPEQVGEKHFLDAWQLVPVIKELGLSQGTLLDIGSGAGFPGIPLAIFLPQLDITLLESMEKRCSFLRQAAEKLGLSNVTVVCNRAEVWGQGEGRARYDMVTARAVAKLAILSEYALPLLKKDGYFLAFKGAKAEEERKEAEHALVLLGGVYARRYDYTLLSPGMGSIIAIQKQGETPAKYPRRAGMPEKKPL